MRKKKKMMIKSQGNDMFDSPKNAGVVTFAYVECVKYLAAEFRI